MLYVGENLSGALDQTLAESGIFSYDQETPPRGAITTGMRICAEVLALESHFMASNLNLPLRDIQAACVELNLNSLRKFIKSRSIGDTTLYKTLIKQLETLLSHIHNRIDIGRNPLMISAHAESKTLENARQKLLNDCYHSILHAERNELPAEADRAKITKTLELAKLLLLGTPEGLLPPANSTLVTAQCQSFYQTIWEYIQEVFYVAPFGAKQIAHYDRPFYDLCLKLIQEKADIFTKKSLWSTIKSLNERFTDPQIRIRELFISFEQMLGTHITLASEQIQLKMLLRELALRYGFTDKAIEILAFNAPQRRVCTTTSVMMLCEFSFRTRPDISEFISQADPNKKAMVESVDTVIWRLSDEEYKFMEVVSKFVNGKNTIRGSLQALMAKLKGCQLDPIHRSKIRIIEELNAVLMRDLGVFSHAISDCVINCRNPDQKLDQLYKLIMGDDFTLYMQDLCLSALLQEQFCKDVKAILAIKYTDEEVLKSQINPFDANLQAGFNHLVKISEDLKRIRKVTMKTIVELAANMEVWEPNVDYVAELMKPWPNGAKLRNQLMSKWEDGANRILLVSQMEEKTTYYLNLANILREFTAVTTQFIENPDAHQQQLSLQLNEVLDPKSAARIRELCRHWLELWEMGYLNIDRVKDDLAKAISGELGSEYQPN